MVLNSWAAHISEWLRTSCAACAVCHSMCLSRVRTFAWIVWQLNKMSRWVSPNKVSLTSVECAEDTIGHHGCTVSERAKKCSPSVWRRSEDSIKWNSLTVCSSTPSHIHVVSVFVSQSKKKWWTTPRFSKTLLSSSTSTTDNVTIVRKNSLLIHGELKFNCDRRLNTRRPSSSLSRSSSSTMLTTRS